jgi:small subunit ribosomal protein S9
MEDTKSAKYIEAVGRRKTAVARVRLTPASKNSFNINDKDLDSYFPTEEMRLIVTSAVKEAKAGSYKISAKLIGGGIHAQSEALRHAISRALVKEDPHTRTTLKKAGMLKRDPRSKERRKFGLKKARKAPQWSKR